jgi:acyl-CoA synthetase (AMP-forming)/AMP-acid ligase II
MTLAISYGESVEAAPYASLRDAIIGAIVRIPDGHFIHARANAPYRTSTYRETLETATDLAVRLRERGTRPGDGLIINLRNSEDFIPALWASALAGFVAVPLVHEIGRSFGEKGGDGVLAFVQGNLKRATLLTDDLLLSASAPLDAVFFPDLAKPSRRRRDIPDVPEAGDERLCLAVLTSGATGRPKMVGLKEGAVLARWWPKLPDGGSTSTFLSWSPFDHVMGLGLAAPNLNRKVHLDAESFVANPLLWLDAMEETRATHATMTNFGVSLIVRAVEANPERSWRLGDIRKIGVGAEPVSPALCRRFLDCLAPFGLRRDAIILGYGLTECGPVVGGGTPFSLGLAPETGGRILLDRPTAGHAVRIVGEDGQNLNEDCVGAIEVRGPTMASGYIGDPAETGRLFTSDGWLRTGDLGVLNEGKLAVIGREKELILVNARKYSCPEIEEAIKARSRFAEVYAAPLDDAVPARGKPFAIFVAVDDVGDFALAEVAVKVRAILASTFRFVPEAVALIHRRDVPRTPLGKVRRLELAAAIGDGRFENQVHRLDSETQRVGNALTGDALEEAAAAAWARLLNCRLNFDRGADFFAMGGDSILASTLLMGVEKRFKRQIALREFFELPTFNNLVRLVRSASAPPANDQDGTLWRLPYATTRGILSYVEAWNGERVSEDRLMLGANRHGSLPPLFCVLQEDYEFQYLATALGPQQPVYAFRSLFHVDNYDEDLIQALALRYVSNIQQAHPDGPLFLLAYCQACRIAIPMAQHLLRRRRHLPLLILVDWTTEPLSYPGEALLLFGRDSPFNPKFASFNPEPAWRRMFGDFSCAVVDGDHDDDTLFQPNPVSLAGEVAQRCAQALDRTRKFSPLEDCAFEFTVAKAPGRARPGARLRFEVSLKNVGTAPIGGEHSNLRVGGFWTRDGEIDGPRFIEATPLPEIAPGAVSVEEVMVPAPENDGKFELALDLFEERGHSLTGLGAAPTGARVKVRRISTRIRNIVGHPFSPGRGVQPR